MVLLVLLVIVSFTLACIYIYFTNLKSKKERRKRFYETGDIKSLLIEDIVEQPDLNQYITNPEKYKSLLEEIDRKNQQQSRSNKIDKLLN